VHPQGRSGHRLLLTRPSRDIAVAGPRRSAIAIDPRPSVSPTCESACRLHHTRPVHRAERAAALAALLFAPGCFYTTSIIERPTADIHVVDPGPHYPDQPVYLAAYDSSDLEDGGDLQCTWSAHSCSDDACTTASELEPPTMIPCDQEWGVTPERARHHPIRVSLTATDRDGGEISDQELIPIGNRPPELTPPQPHFPANATSAAISLPVRVSVEVSDADGDEVQVTWNLVKPRGGGADVELRPVDDSPLTQEFIPDVASLWTVEVTADDSLDGGQVTSEVPIQVLEDQPPCIEHTSPAADPEAYVVLQREDGPRSFSVLFVSDDLDPYPRLSDEPYFGDPEFTWLLASPDTGGRFVPVAGAASPEFAIDPAAYAPGDRVDLRVEVSDRVERDVSCDEEQPTCSLTGGTCYQRLTWGVEIR
jgi:hypothetical protein